MNQFVYTWRIFFHCLSFAYLVRCESSGSNACVGHDANKGAPTHTHKQPQLFHNFHKISTRTLFFIFFFLFFFLPNSLCDVCSIFLLRRGGPSTTKMEVKTSLLDNMIGVGDMVLLEPLSEDSFLENLKKRFDHNEIYVSLCKLFQSCLSDWLRVERLSQNLQGFCSELFN